MNPEFKALWLAALRSKKHEQGQGRLRIDYDTGPKFCCLGVCEDVMIPHTGNCWHGGLIIGPRNAGSNSTLLENTINLLGENPTDFVKGLTDRDGRPMNLIHLNDMDSPLTFDQIADVVDYFY